MSKEKKSKRKGRKCTTLYVSGMHCPSCEILIEKKILKVDGVTLVDASLSHNTVLVCGDAKESIPTPEVLTAIFEEDGYAFSYAPLTQAPRGQLLSYIIALNLVLLLLFIASVMDTSTLARFTSVDATSSFVAFVILGIIASVSSCAALIGGLLLSLSKQWHDASADDSRAVQLQPHARFHSGRLVAFILGGAILGLFGNILSFENVTVYAILILLVSLIMLILGLQMLNVKFVQRLRFSLPKSMTTRLAQGDGKSRTPFLIGAGTFFLPCGFTLIAQGAALASGSVVTGAIIMGSFAIGTLPVLGTISFSGFSFMKRPHTAARFQIIAGALVVMFALFNINGQLNVMGWSSLSDFTQQKTRVTDQQEVAQVNPTDGQVLKVIARDFEYVPTTPTTLKAGVPTTLIVDNQGVQGCGAFMAARGLWDGLIDLQLGENIKTFTPEEGTYKITCTMGMVPPVIINVVK